MNGMKKTVLLSLLVLGGAAQAQKSLFSMNTPSTLYVTTSGSVRMPFKFYEVSGQEVPRLRTDPILNRFYTAISEYVEAEGYNYPCSGRDAFMFQGTPSELKSRQQQWMATLKKSPANYREVERSMGDQAQDADGTPITLDTYLMKGSDDQNHVRSFTFVNYPYKGHTWVLTCRSGRL